MSLPVDDNILLSLVNTRLRDGASLDDFCAEYGVTQAELLKKLSEAGYAYDEENNSFKRV